jgi:hypothetical protein
MLIAGKSYVAPKFQNLTDFDLLMKLLDQYGSAVSQKEVTRQGRPSQSNDVTVSVVRSTRYWNYAHYPITHAWFERFQIHMSCLILCSILCFIHLTVIVYTSKL